MGNANPITSIENQNGERSSESLFFGDKSKIRSQIIKPVDEVSDEIEEIVLEEPVRDNLMPNRLGKDADKLPNSLDAKNNQMINYTGYDLDSTLLQLQESSD